MRQILFVDDEPAVLAAIKKALRPFRAEWDVALAEGGQAGVDALTARPFDVVVSDARMPGVDGEKVLLAAQRLRPDAIRVVLSGQAERSSGHRLTAVAHQFLAKPCDARAVLGVVEAACAVRDSLANPTLRTLVAQLGELPLPPTTYQRLVALLETPDASTDSVSKVVEQNPLVSAIVLRLVSSAFFGLPRRVSNVREAVVLLGLESIKQVVLMAEVFRTPDALGVVQSLQDRALRRLALVRQLAQGSPMAPLAAEAALMVDLGAYVLALKRADLYAPIWSQALAGDRALVAIELEVLGVTHAAVGAALLSLWNVAPTVVEAVAHHHEEAVAGMPYPDCRAIAALACALEEEPRLRGAARDACSVQIERLVSVRGLGDRLATLRAVAQRAGGEEQAA